MQEGGRKGVQERGKALLGLMDGQACIKSGRRGMQFMSHGVTECLGVGSGRGEGE